MVPHRGMKGTGKASAPTLVVPTDASPNTACPNLAVPNLGRLWAIANRLAVRAKEKTQVRAKRCFIALTPVVMNTICT